MDAEIRELSDRILSAGRAHDRSEPDHDRRYRNLDRESARLLNILARRAGRVLEIGTSNGYSTIWLADALEPHARMVSVDNDAARHAEAAGNLAAAGLAERVDLVLGDGADVLAATAPASVDLLLLDADRAAYVSYWPDLRRVLRPGGLLVVDNCTSHAAEVAEFRRLVETAPGVDSVLVPLGAGLLFISTST
ncbi:MAG: O-methyltransferase [Propionibacterium acidifaciens]